MGRKGLLQCTTVLICAIFINLQASAQQVKPNLRMGVLSDIHVCDDESEGSFRHALEYFRDKEVDGVIIAGDMADHGLTYELLRVSRAWYSVFPKDRRPDGAHVEKVFVYGNHDSFGDPHSDWFNALPKEQSKLGYVRENYGGNWKKYFKEDFSQVYMKEVKGYKFIGCHWSFENDRQECGAPEFVKAHAAELEGEKPFFYVQHAHLAHTCNGEWAWGQDDGVMTGTLKAFPNAVALSGHSHDPLTDGRDLWQGEFTSIGTASLRYVLPIDGRENSSLDGEERDIPCQMPAIEGHYCHHGMVMSVYDDRISFERREFYYDESLGDDWVVPLPKGADAPLSYENMARTAPIPQFADDAKVSLSPFFIGEDRYGVETEQIEVTFPAVKIRTTGVRAFDYEVQIEQRYADLTTVVGTKHVYSAHCYYGEDHDDSEVKCVFAKKELPLMYEYRFVVRPCECYGGKGDPIFSEWQKVPDSKSSQLSCAPEETEWDGRFESMLPLLGHRNWIVVADMAYPLQSGEGITTIYADEDYLDVLAKVKSSIDAAPHVYPHIWRDRELGFIDESLMPGIDATKAGIEGILGPEAKSIDHEDLIKRLDEAGGLYQVVIIKTPMTTPYTTVFFELDCDYWNAEKADILNRKMGR